jgi:hypothetical protein
LVLYNVPGIIESTTYISSFFFSSGVVRCPIDSQIPIFICQNRSCAYLGAIFLEVLAWCIWRWSVAGSRKCFVVPTELRRRSGLKPLTTRPETSGS